MSCGDFVFRGISELDETGQLDAGAIIDSEIEGLCLISQTCAGVRDPTRIAQVSVAPLVKLDPNGIADVKRGAAPRFCIVDNLPDGVVVDLTRVMSISKELLISFERQRGCENEAAQNKFARALEIFFGRFAFPDDFVGALQSFRSSVLSKHSRPASDFGKAFRSIREIRVLPHASWQNTDSIPITFIVIIDDDGKREVEDRNKILEQIQHKVDDISFQKPFQKHDMSIWMVTLNDITAADYLNSYPLDINSITLAQG
jgi:hypothetical protein